MLTSKNRVQDECFRVDKHRDHPKDGQLLLAGRPKTVTKLGPQTSMLSVSGFRVMRVEIPRN